MTTLYKIYASKRNTHNSVLLRSALRENMRLIERNIMSEAVDKKSLQQAAQVIKKLGEISKTANLQSVATAVGAVRDQITQDMGKSGGWQGYLQNFIDTARKEWNLPTIKRDPMIIAVKFANSLIDGFSKLSDVIELHSDTQKEVDAGGADVPQQRKGTDVLSQRKDPDVAAPATPGTQQGVDTLRAALASASPKYAKNAENIIRNLFDTGEYKGLIDEKKFIDEILNTPTKTIVQIGKSLAELNQLVDTTSKSISASAKEPTQSGEQGEQAPSQQAPQKAAEAGITFNTEELQSVKNLSTMITKYLASKKLALETTPEFTQQLAQLLQKHVKRPTKQSEEKQASEQTP